MFDGGIVCCDFLGGDVVQLYCLIQCLLVLFDVICVFVCYDYGLGGCDFVNEIIIGEQCVYNIYVYDGVVEVEFVSVCQVCDVILEELKLMQLVVKVNIQGGV